MMRLFSKPDDSTKSDDVSKSAQFEAERTSTTFIKPPIFSLQRVWKTFVKGRDEFLTGNSTCSCDEAGDYVKEADFISSVLFTPADGLDACDSHNLNIKYSCNSSDEKKISNIAQNIPELELSFPANLGVDSETESIVSDYSEMADPVKEHLANVRIIRCSDVDPNLPPHYVVRPKVFQGVEEDEQKFIRRLRKTNFLSLAQEFAELKKQDADVLPFNLHEDRYRELQDSESETDETEQLSVDSFSTTDVSICSGKYEGEYDSGWHDCSTGQPEANLEERHVANGVTILISQLSETIGDEVLTPKGNETFSLTKQSVISHCGCTSEKVPDVVPDKLSTSQSTRSNILKHFSKFYIGEQYCSIASDNTKSDSTVCSNHKLVDRQTCGNGSQSWDLSYMERWINKASETHSNLQSGCQGERDEICRKLAAADDESWYKMEEKPHNFMNSIQSGTSLDICYVNEAADDLDVNSWCSDCSRPDVVPFDENCEDSDANSGNYLGQKDLLIRQSYVETEVKLALANVGTMQHISQKLLEQMTLTQLQILANDLLEQIEVLNKELVLSLIDRNDLQLIQDSMLVDIEDLTGQAEDYAARIDDRTRKQQTVNLKSEMK